MGHSFNVHTICYIVIHRSWVNNNSNIPLRSNQTVADWIVSQFPGFIVIPGVTEDTAIFDKDNKHLRYRLDEISVPKFNFNNIPGNEFSFHNIIHENNAHMEVQHENEELSEEDDNDWAAIIISNMKISSYKGKPERESDNFNPFNFAKLFNHPEIHLWVLTETDCHMSE